MPRGKARRPLDLTDKKQNLGQFSTHKLRNMFDLTMVIIICVDGLNYKKY